MSLMEFVATVLDLLGGLLLVAALAVLAWPVHPALGLAAAGVGMVVLSWLGERARTRVGSRASRRKAGRR